MARNVFGDPIFEKTLMAMPEYTRKKITRKDLAQVALQMKNSQDKDVDAHRHVDRIKQKWGSGTATMCLIYNATGGTLTLVEHHDWHGHVGPIPYPVELANGQWGAFLHVRPTGFPTGSSGAVIYRGKNGEGNYCDWIAAWSNPWNRLVSKNEVFAFVREKRCVVDWDEIATGISAAWLQDIHRSKGCKAVVATGNSKYAYVEAVFTLDDLEGPS